MYVLPYVHAPRSLGPDVLHMYYDPAVIKPYIRTFLCTKARNPTPELYSLFFCLPPAGRQEKSLRQIFSYPFAYFLYNLISSILATQHIGTLSALLRTTYVCTHATLAVRSLVDEQFLRASNFYGM